MNEALRKRLGMALAGQYRIDRELGAGGMAVVYVAHDERHDRDVALKVLRPEIASVLGVERFLHEIRVNARLDHPHILTLIDSGERDGFLWYVMPYVRGESLRQKLDREKQLSLDEALAITQQLAGALAYAHAHGVIHRDVKPENILFQEGEAVLADFGIALAVREAGGDRLTKSGLSLGTPQYMSPEQATGSRHIDARSDEYSLAAVLYEMLAGEQPHTGPTAHAVIAKMLTERPTRLRTLREALPEAVDRGVAKALAKVPADRFPSVTAFVDALADETSAARQSRRRWLKAVGAGAGLAVVAAGAALVVGALAPRAPRSNPGPVQITHTGTAVWPALSPNGAMIAYVRNECGEPGRCGMKLMVRETATTGARAVDSVADGVISWPTWSPDGLRILYRRSTPAGASWYEVSRLGGVPVRIACCAAAYASTRDTMIVLDRQPNDARFWMRTVRASTGEVLDSVPVAPFSEAVHPNLSVSPDGRWIALTTASETYPFVSTVRLGDRRGHMRDSVRTPTWVAQWAAGSDALYLWEGHLERTLPEGPLVRRRLDRTTGRFGPQEDTVVSRLPVGLVLGVGTFPDFRVGDHGHSLVYEALHTSAARLWLYHRPGGRRPPERVREIPAPGADSYDWEAISPDGRRVGYDRLLGGETGDRVQVEVVWVAGAEARPIGSPVPRDEFWDWGWMDDTHLWIAVRTSNHRLRITVYPATGGQSKPFAVIDSAYGSLREMGDGRMAAVPSMADGDTLLVLSPGGGLREFPVPESAAKVWQLAPSPDGKELVTMGFAKGELPLRLHLCIVTVADGIFRCLPVPAIRMVGRALDWTSDGWIHFLAASAGQAALRLYRLRPGSDRMEPEPTPDVVTEAPVVGSLTLSMSRDGHEELVGRGQLLTDIWLLRNFDQAQDR